MVFLLIGSHRISHLTLKQSQSIIPSLYSLLFPVVYPEVPFLAHFCLLSILSLSARWSQKKNSIPSNIICTLIKPSCTPVSLLQIVFYISWNTTTFTDFLSNKLFLNPAKSYFLLIGPNNNNVSNFRIWQTHLSAMISSQSVPLLAILASSLTLTCLSLIKSTLYPKNLVIFVSKTSVKFVIFSSFYSHNSLPIHLSPANLTTAIHNISYKQISTNFNTLKIHWHVSLQTLQNINTSHYNTQISTLVSNQTKNRLPNSVFSHTKPNTDNY